VEGIGFSDHVAYLALGMAFSKALDWKGYTWHHGVQGSEELSNRYTRLLGHGRVLLIDITKQTEIMSMSIRAVIASG
jgi:hypothetical protein